MIKGIIENGIHPRITITLVSETESFDFIALVDSGFDGQLALPYDVADNLSLEVIRLAEVTYAYGQRMEEIVCGGEILWHNAILSVEILLSDDEDPAIGTRLLKDCILTMNFIRNTLTIEKRS